MKKIIIALLLASTVFVGCKDRFADENTNPSNIKDANVKYLFTKALVEFNSSDYTYWFYNYKYNQRWTQVTTGEGEFGSHTPNATDMNKMGEYETPYNVFVKVKVVTEEINMVLNSYPADVAKKYENIRVMCNPLNVYLGILGTDVYGSMPYTEAGKIFQQTSVLTPKFENQKELFTVWLAQLDETITVLSKNLPGQEALGAQDFVYKGDRLKWLKFTNSLKLKIAVRLLSIDKTLALKVAKEVVDSPVGIMTSNADDFLYSKGIEEYGTENNFWLGTGSKHLVDFMVENKDPRVRFMFSKNSFNSNVVQYFLTHIEENPTTKIKLPSYVEKLVETEIVNGKKVFKAWKAPGEPWVRYHGSPINILAKDTAATNDDYFNANLFKIDKTGYVPTSRYQEENVRGHMSYLYPDKDGVSPIKDEKKTGIHYIFLSAAEVQLYLAELKLQGAAIPTTVQDLYEAGITLSVNSMDILSRKNNIPYYGKTYVNDPFDKPIDLQAGEIAALLTQPAYQLTGSVQDQLEKVYIQQYLNFLNMPNEQFVSVRRSGVPKKGSNVLAWQVFSGDDSKFFIPRRFEIQNPLKTDIMHDIKAKAYEEEGFSLSTNSDPETLNKERVWYDKNSPNYGQGPKLY